MSGPERSVLKDLLGVAKPVIGTVHLLPLPGAPRYEGDSMSSILERARKDARAYADGGVDALIVENEGDIPFLKPDQIGPETVACLTSAAQAVGEAVDIPIGIMCLANAAIESLAIAKAVDAKFIRSNQWANAYVANEGIIEGAAAQALRFRSAIHGQTIRVLADVHVKHGSHAIVADRDIAELARDVEAFDADVLIATGQRTGDPTQEQEVNAIKKATTREVLVGSGLTADNAAELIAVADGAIVGSSMKMDGVWWQPVDPQRVRQVMREISQVRETSD